MKVQIHVEQRGIVSPKADSEPAVSISASERRRLASDQRLFSVDLRRDEMESVVYWGFKSL
jgi:hypothetical protein